MPCLRILSHSANRERRQRRGICICKDKLQWIPLVPRLRLRAPVCLFIWGRWSVPGYLYSGPGVCLAAAHYYPAHDRGVSLPRSDQSVYTRCLCLYSTLPLLNQTITFIFLSLSDYFPVSPWHRGCSPPHWGWSAAQRSGWPRRSSSARRPRRTLPACRPGSPAGGSSRRVFSEKDPLCYKFTVYCCWSGMKVKHDTGLSRVIILTQQGRGLQETQV